MIKRFCDVCDAEVEKFHGYGGNVSSFGVTEACDKCWEFLNKQGSELLEDFEAQQDKRREAVVGKILRQAREAR